MIVSISLILSWSADT